MNYHVFLDFDGTVTTEDVGYNFFKVFAEGEAEGIVKSYRDGEITAAQCLQGECDIYNEYPAPAMRVRQFISSQKLTTGFKEFVEYCRNHDFSLTIISAGFDFYIRPILRRNGFDELEVFANKTTIKNGRIYPEFTYYEEKTCPRCSNCKGLRIKELTGADETSVFIGDGHSDGHGARAADIVFAKSFLAEYLQQAKINFFAFNNFFDIIEKFDNMLLKNG